MQAVDVAIRSRAFMCVCGLAVLYFASYVCVNCHNRVVIADELGWKGGGAQPLGRKILNLSAALTGG